MPVVVLGGDCDVFGGDFQSMAIGPRYLLSGFTSS